MNIYQGNSKSIPVNVTKNGVPMDITGLSLLFTVKNLSGEIVISKTITSHIDTANGKTGVILTMADTMLPLATYTAFYTLLDNINSRITFKKHELIISMSEQ